MNAKILLRVGIAVVIASALLHIAKLNVVASGRPRLIIETDAGGDPDDEQSLVRFLLYSNEWDIEGIIANRPQARDRENLNPVRTGLGIVQRLLKAYGQCYPNLSKHDARFPKPEFLLQRTVAGDNNTEAAVNLILNAVDKPDPRPLWYSDWGTDHGAATNNLRRALDRVLAERGPAGYAQFKSRLRLSSADAFGPHTTNISPPFVLWVDTFRPPLDGKRWYHRFSALTATAGGFDLKRDMLTGHGALGALYPTNTTHWQKEGDTMTFLFLVPTGMNDPEHPTWGSWAGRYGPMENYPDRNYFWANTADAWNGTTNRDNVLGRWAADLQNDFRARLNWCVKPFDSANHPPLAVVAGPLQRSVSPGALVRLSAVESRDPDRNRLSYQWIFYPEVGSYKGPLTIQGEQSARASFTAPKVSTPETIHIILRVTDNGNPPLSRYERVIFTIDPTRPK